MRAAPPSDRPAAGAGLERPPSRSRHRTDALRALPARTPVVAAAYHGDRPRRRSRSSSPPATAAGPAGAGRGVRTRPGRPLHPAESPAVLGRPRRLSARVVHHEVQPQGLRRRWPACPDWPTSIRRPRPRAPRAGSRSWWSSKTSCARSRDGGRHPPTGGRRRRGTHRAPAHAGLARGPGPDPPQDRDPRLGPRHQSGLGDPGRLRRGDRASDGRGCVDLAALRAVLDEDVAGIMLTNPNTLGLFEEDIAAIAAAVHEVGGLLYYDGANLNAIVGVVRPGTWASTSST